MYELKVIRLKDNKVIFLVKDSKENLAKEYEHYKNEFVEDKKMAGKYEVTMTEVWLPDLI